MIKKNVKLVSSEADNTYVLHPSTSVYNIEGLEEYVRRIVAQEVKKQLSAKG